MPACRCARECASAHVGVAACVVCPVVVQGDMGFPSAASMSVAVCSLQFALLELLVEMCGRAGFGSKKTSPRPAPPFLGPSRPAGFAGPTGRLPAPAPAPAGGGAAASRLAARGSRRVGSGRLRTSDFFPAAPVSTWVVSTCRL
jgi:hypothetical protein